MFHQHKACSNNPKTNLTNNDDIEQIARQQANKAHLVLDCFSQQRHLGQHLRPEISLQQNRDNMRLACSFSLTSMRLFIVYSTDTVYISIIHKHRRSPCLKMKTSETYRQLLDAARRLPATRFSLHSTSQIAETDQKKNKHKLNYCDNYCGFLWLVKAIHYCTDCI